MIKLNFIAILFLGMSSLFAQNAKNVKSQTSKGDSLVTTYCRSCHALDRNVIVGPSLFGITEKRNKQWLSSYIPDAMKMVSEKDSIAVALFAKYHNVNHPNFSELLSKDDVESIILFLSTKK